MQPNGHHLHEHIFLKASISRARSRAHACVYACVRVQSRKPGANASCQIGGDEVGERDIPGR